MLILCPSKVTFSLPFNSWRSLSFSASSSILFSVCALISSSGSKVTVPSKPSTTAVIPVLSSSRSIGTPIRAGMFIIRARIAVWELVEPWTVTNARILSLSIWTVSLGLKSSATITDGSIELKSVSSCPLKLRTRRSEISLISAERAFM